MAVVLGHQEVDPFWSQHLLLGPLGLDLILEVFEMVVEVEEMEDSMEEESRKLDQTVGCRWEEKAYSSLGPDAMERAGEAILLLLTREVVAAARSLHNQEDAGGMHTVHPMEKKGEEASHANENHKAHFLRKDQRMHFPHLIALSWTPSSYSSSCSHKQMEMQN